MKKFLLVSVIVAAAISSYAADLKLSGDFYARGTTVKNQALTDGNEIQYSYFDYDLNLKAALVVNEQAQVIVKLTYDKPYHNSNVTMGSGSASDAGLAIENAFLDYKFNTGTIVDVGLMPGGQWASAFGNTEVNVMRVKITQAFSPEFSLLLIYQKNAEFGATQATVGTAPNTTQQVQAGAKDAEKNDSTTYYAAAIIKAGPLKISPLFAYTLQGINQDKATALTNSYMYKSATYDLGLSGDFGVIGFDSEFIYSTKDTDKIKDDPTATAAQKLIQDEKKNGYFC